MIVPEELRDALLAYPHPTRIDGVDMSTAEAADQIFGPRWRTADFATTFTSGGSGGKGKRRAIPTADLLRAVERNALLAPAGLSGHWLIFRRPGHISSNFLVACVRNCAPIIRIDRGTFNPHYAAPGVRQDVDTFAPSVLILVAGMIRFLLETGGLGSGARYVVSVGWGFTRYWMEEVERRHPGCLACDRYGMGEGMPVGYAMTQDKRDFGDHIFRLFDPTTVHLDPQGQIHCLEGAEVIETLDGGQITPEGMLRIRPAQFRQKWAQDRWKDHDRPFALADGLLTPAEDEIVRLKERRSG